MPDEQPELEQVQRWMQAVIMHHDGVLSGLGSREAGDVLPIGEDNLESLVLPSSQLSSLERLSIYGEMYLWRLRDILGEEFPTVRQLFGPELFDQVVGDYVQHHPSTHYSLIHLGTKFPAFLAAGAQDIPHREIATDIARVERAMEDVFDAPHAEPIAFEDLAAIPLESWGDVYLETVPALRLLQLAYPVNTFITAVREDRHLDVPAASPAYIAVYRHDYLAWRIDLDVQRFTLLSALADGETLGAALELCASLPDADPARLMGSIGDWFREWTSQGMFSSASLST